MTWHQSLGYGKNRQADDYYTTPREAVVGLIKKETFENPVWECASGSGAISKVLEEFGYQVISSDIRSDNIYGEGGVDFLKTEKEVKSIITNPPFKLTTEFILQALKMADKVAIFNRIQLLEGQERFDRIYSRTPPKRVLVFSKRVSTLKEGKGKANGTVCFAWYIWEKGFSGRPEILWI